MDFFNEKSAPKGRICRFCAISFKGFIKKSFEYRNLTKVIAARLLTNFTSVLYRITEWRFLRIFFYTELLFLRQPESDGDSV